MHYLLFSFSYKKVALKDREKLDFKDDISKISFYKSILLNDKIDEMILLCTCNRMEIILATQDISNNTQYFVLDRLSKIVDMNFIDIQNSLQLYKDNEAVYHIFEVASSLDSLVIGETQIVGQLKDAFRFASKYNFCSIHLSRVLHSSFKCSANIRNATSISQNSISVASVSVSKAKNIFGKLKNKKAVVIGVGEMGKIVIKHLLSNECFIVIVSKDIEKDKLKLNIQSELISYENSVNLKDIINNHQLLFCATNSKDYIITKDMIKQVDIKREWFDLALPRDIENIKIQNLNIHTIDDLKQIANNNIQKRKDDLIKAKDIIKQQTEDFYKLLDNLDVVPIIKEIRYNAKTICIDEVQKAIKKGFIKKEQQENTIKLLHSVFNRFLHKPTIVLKELPDKYHSDHIIEFVKILFDLKDNQDSHLCDK